MKILVTYFTQSNNTKAIAESIFDELEAQNQVATIESIENVKPESLNEYDLVFIGSACHHADVAAPVKRLLKGISSSPPFKMAGFVTHATKMAEGSERNKELYERWAGKCVKTFTRFSEKKNIEFLGYFHCKGRPIPPIADFIHQEIILDETEWEEYKEEIITHPDEKDHLDAKAFARSVLSKLE
jgi:flavodoxin